MTGSRLTNDFWQWFLTKKWEKEPVRLPGFGAGFTSADEVFQAVVRKPGRSRSDRVWLANERGGTLSGYETRPLSTYGPTARDRSFDGYFTRLCGELGSQSFGVNVQALQTADASLWLRCLEFVEPVNAHAGLPTQRWDVDTFLGTYRMTPFGIHVDNASVFVVGVAGRRTYYAWPRDYFTDGHDALHTPDAAKVEPHLRFAVRLDLEPGDVVYWPSSYWHLATSDGNPSVVMQVSAYFGQRLSELAATVAEELLSARLQANRALVYPRTPHDRVPPEFILAEQVLRDTLDSGLFSQRLRVRWLQHSTAGGFADVPAPAAAAQLPSDGFVRLRLCSSLAWMRTTAGEIIVACNGSLFAAPEDPLLLEVLDRLKSGRTVGLAPLTSRAPEERALLDDVLAELSRRHALRTIVCEDAVSA